MLAAEERCAVVDKVGLADTDVLPLSDLNELCDTEKLSKGEAEGIPLEVTMDNCVAAGVIETFAVGVCVVTAVQVDETAAVAEEAALEEARVEMLTLEVAVRDASPVG